MGKPAASVFGLVGKATGQPEISAAGQIFSGLNKGVSMIPTMQNLDFWSDFGRGFQQGFGMVMQPAAQIAGGIGSAMGIPEANAAGQIFSGLNGAVQSFG